MVRTKKLEEKTDKKKKKQKFGVKKLLHWLLLDKLGHTQKITQLLLLYGNLLNMTNGIVTSPTTRGIQIAIPVVQMATQGHSDGHSG